MASSITQGLNAEQTRAVEAVRGPVRILAGAGTGKTTTITRRMAHQVRTNTFQPGEVLAVTFTEKAAGEMRSRLAALGVDGVRARTFHSAAHAQLRHLADSEPPRILPSKVLALRQIASSLPKPYRFRPAADLATEIEWAKNRRISCDHYVDSLGGHEPPIPVDVMARVWLRYEEGKRTRELMDFEDLLEMTVRMYEQDDYALHRFQHRYRAFTVDEYQDVNLLQESLLRCWLGERDDICVVGDDYQSIYGFTGASPRYLIDMPARLPRTMTVTLETNYRSTPDVLDVANRVARDLGGSSKVLRAAGAPGPAPVIRGCASMTDETRLIVERLSELSSQGVDYSEMAILYRVNFRSEDYEEALAAARIPFVVRDGGFLERRAARRMLQLFRSRPWTDVSARVRREAERAGWLEDTPDRLGENELTRQRDLTRLVQLADELDDGERTGADFVLAVEERFGGREDSSGVNLLTLHRAKGLEFDAVFMPRLQEGELPFKRATSEEALEEERRLFYVGITRARRHLTLTWVGGARAQRSRFLDSIAPRVRHAQEMKSVRASRTMAAVPSTGDPSEALRSWRARRAASDGVPAFIVMHDKTLEAIAERRPSTLPQLGDISGMGAVKVDRYGAEILALLEALPAPSP